MAVVITVLKKPSLANETFGGAGAYGPCELKLTHTSGDTYATGGQALTKAAIIAALGVSAFTKLANFRGKTHATSATNENGCFYDDGNEKIILLANNAQVSNGASLTSRVDYLECDFIGE